MISENKKAQELSDEEPRSRRIVYLREKENDNEKAPPSNEKLKQSLEQLAIKLMILYGKK
jgi:hypothetical protein